MYCVEAKSRPFTNFSFKLREKILCNYESGTLHVIVAASMTATNTNTSGIRYSLASGLRFEDK